MYQISQFCPTVELLMEPVECMMGQCGCNEAVCNGWTLGLTGSCVNPKAGFCIGKGAVTMVSLQVGVIEMKERIFILSASPSLTSKVVQK